MSLRRSSPRSRRRFDREPPLRVILRGLAVAAVLGALGYIAVSAYNGVPGRSYDYVNASVPETGNLIPHDPVRIGGKRVGQVRSIGSGPDGGGVVRLQLDAGTSLPSDTRILLRANGLLGARYVELIPGHSGRPLAPGATLRGGADALTYGVPEALDVFDRETRGGLRSMVGELGKGLVGQGRDLNEALRLGGHAIVPFRRLIARLNEPSASVDQLVGSLDSAMTALDANRRPLGRLFGTAATALQPIADRGDAVRATLREAPLALGAADAGLTRGRELLGAARSLAAEARVTLLRAPGGLRAAAALLREGPRPLRRTRSLLRAARPAIPATLRITSGLSPLLQPLHEAFSDLTPMSKQIARFECDLTSFASVFRSMTGFGGNGEGPNGPAMAFRLQVTAPVPDEALSTKDTSGLLHREGYPEPCKYVAKPYPIVPRPGGAGR